MQTRTVSHRIRLAKPSNSQKSVLGRAFGASRFAYNQCKNLSETYYKETGKSLSKLALRNRFVQEVKPQHEWLRELPKSIAEEAAFDFHRSLTAFFKRRHGFPKFRSRKSGRSSFRVNNAQFKVDGNYITVTKLGTFKLTESLRFEGKILNATFSESQGKFYVSIQVETDVGPLPQTGGEVGIDINVHTLNDSDRNVYARPDTSSLDKKLRNCQRSASRKKKGSKNRGKANLKVSNLHARISNIRNDFHHKLSTKLITDNSVLCVEDLNVSGMVKNRNLARSISTSTFARFITMLEYKSINNNRQFVKVGRFFPSSKTCSGCGWVKPNLSLSQRIFKCEKCHLSIDRDLNAAKNILAEGLRLLDSNNDPRPSGDYACGEDVRRGCSSTASVLYSKKQEPIIIPA